MSTSKKKFKVFVTREIPNEGLSLMKKKKGIDLRVFSKDRKITRAELLKAVRGCDAILPLLTEKIDGKVMDAAGPQLKVIANYAVGYDNIDVAAATKRGIIVANTPGVLTEAVAEHTFALMMSLARRIPESDVFTREGKYKAWEPMLLLGPQMAGKTLGVLGLGRIGQTVAKKAALGMDMNIMYYDIARNKAFEKKFNAKYGTIDAVLKNADFISVHVPLLPSTHHLINAKRLRSMKKTSYLINTSRGPVVDEKALVSALKTGKIAGAALDVFENEPKLSVGLKSLKNVVITPHTASATLEARSAMSVLAANAVIAVFLGKKPTNIVIPR